MTVKEETLIPRAKRLNEAYEYLKSEGKVHTKKELATKIGVSYANVSSAMKGDLRYLTNSFLLKFNNAFGGIFDFDWLNAGWGHMILDKEVTSVKKDISPAQYETYLLPLSAMGGPLSGFAAEGVVLPNCEKIVSPIGNVDFAITVYGESMFPKYPSGTRLLIKKIDPSLFIDWGKSYVLDTSNGVIVKEVRASHKEGYITCCSVNPDPKFEPFDVPLSEVYGMYRVLMSLSAE